MTFDAGRRTLLLAGLGLALTGCAAKPLPLAVPTTTPRASPPPPSRDPAPETSPPTPLPVPTREEIVQRFTGTIPQHWGLDVPGVLSVLPAAVGGAVLTLDYCGGPGGSQTDHRILDLLRDRNMPATLFLNARWIESNRTLAGELAEDPLFELANHGSQHLPLSVSGQAAYGIPGTAGPGEVYDEIMTNTAVLTELTGVPPRFFRSGTAHLDEVAAQICLALGQTPTGFSINGDAGATHPAYLVAQELGRANSGDIIIAHGNQPAAGTGEGLPAALDQLAARQVELIALPPSAPLGGPPA